MTRIEKGAIILTGFAAGLLATIWVLEKRGVFS
jgi:hypothetical protein